MENPTYEGIDRRQHTGKIDQFLVIKSWHTVIIVLSIIVSITLAYASLRDGHDEDARRIHDLEQRPAVSQESINDLNYRLQRLELKLDRQDLNEFDSILNEIPPAASQKPKTQK